MKLLLVLVLAGLPAVAAAEDRVHIPAANPNYTPAPPKEGYSYPDCFCTDSTGGRVEMGEVACLKIGSREVLARCAFSVNNPAWRTLSEGCPGV